MSQLVQEGCQDKSVGKPAKNGQFQRMERSAIVRTGVRAKEKLAPCQTLLCTDSWDERGGKGRVDNDASGEERLSKLIRANPVLLHQSLKILPGHL